MVYSTIIEVKIEGELSSCNSWLLFGKHRGKNLVLGILQTLSFLDLRGNSTATEDPAGNFHTCQHNDSFSVTPIKFIMMCYIDKSGKRYCQGKYLYICAFNPK